MAYIEREALEHHFMTTKRYLTKDLVRDAVYEINKFPAADVAPVVRGRWVPVECGTFCTHCTRVFDMHFEIARTVCLRLPHCPNCGARMDGDKK